MSSSSSPSSALSPTSPTEQTPPRFRPFFLEPPGLSDQENVLSGAPPGHRQLRDSQSRDLRFQDRQDSAPSIPPSGAITPSNHFSTPTTEATNPFSSVTKVGEGLSAYSSLENSAIDLQQRHSGTPREAFSSPRPRPLTVVYPSKNQGTRSRLSRRKRPASTMLSAELSKPWMGKKDKAARISYLLTYSMLLLGIAAAALRCYTGWRSVPLVGKLCLVMEDDFNSNSLDTGVWTLEVDLGGYG